MCVCVCVCVCVCFDDAISFCRDYREGGVAVGPDSKVASALLQVRNLSNSYMRLQNGKIEDAVMAKQLQFLAGSVDELVEEKQGKTFSKDKLDGYHRQKVVDLKDMLKRRGLSAGGNKEDLVGRLAASDTKEKEKTQEKKKKKKNKEEETEEQEEQKTKEKK